MLDVGDFRELVVRPALRHLAEAAREPRLWGQAAENLVVGTAAYESGGFRHLWQKDANGVRLAHGKAARGLFQIQPDTHQDLWRNYLRFRPALADALTTLSTLRSATEDGSAVDGRVDVELVGNLPYAAGVCRLIYWRVPPPLPPPENIDGLGRYWKDHYNTAKGGGTAAQFIFNYRTYVKE